MNGGPWRATTGQTARRWGHREGLSKQARGARVAEQARDAAGCWRGLAGADEQLARAVKQTGGAEAGSRGVRAHAVSALEPAEKNQRRNK